MLATDLRGVNTSHSRGGRGWVEGLVAVLWWYYSNHNNINGVVETPQFGLNRIYVYKLVHSIIIEYMLYMQNT